MGFSHCHVESRVLTDGTNRHKRCVVKAEDDRKPTSIICAGAQVVAAVVTGVPDMRTMTGNESAKEGLMSDPVVIT